MSDGARARIYFPRVKNLNLLVLKFAHWIWSLVAETKRYSEQKFRSSIDYSTEHIILIITKRAIYPGKDRLNLSNPKGVENVIISIFTEFSIIKGKEKR